MSDLLKVGLVQQACCADRSTNLQKSAGFIREAASQGAQLVILPELHAGPYFCQTADPAAFDLAETIPGRITGFFGEVAGRSGVTVVASLFEKRAVGVCHNTAVVLDSEGRLVGKYRKMHIPDDPGFYEKFYFMPGDLGFVPISASCGKLGVLVCWDQWFPEAARVMALAGAALLIYPTAIGWDPRDGEEEQQRQRDAWLIAQRAHAISNGIPVISVNRVGFEPDPSEATAGINFWGSSFAAGPQGEILAMAATNEEQVLVVELDLNRSEAVRRIWPFLRDRRVDGYSGLLRRYLED